VPFTDLGAMAEEVWADLQPILESDIRGGRYIGGEAVEQFEEDWAAYCGVPHAIGVANGTDALALALRAAGIGPGDDVIVPASTFIASAEAVAMAGATPVFCDVDPGTMLMTVSSLEDALTANARAVLVVHLYGQMPDMDALTQAARRHNLVLIEDAAQAHGATWRGKPAGSWGAAGAFSFYPGKNLGAFGDAGAVVTTDSLLAEKVRSLANHGRDLGSHYEHSLVGVNSRLDALQARVLTAKLKRLDSWTERRRRLVEIYRDELRGTRAQVLDVAAAAGHVYHLAVVRVPSRSAIQQSLAEAGIGTGVHYPVPCHQQRAFLRDRKIALPNAEAGANEVLSLPLSPSMTGAEAKQVCVALIEALEIAGYGREGH
jgi:dTDP-4-amino-4,6-dideoxygalactose transaminase